LFLRIGYPGAGYICNDFPVKEKSIAEQVQILLDIVLHFLHTHPGRSVLSCSGTINSSMYDIDLTTTTSPLTSSAPYSICFKTPYRVFNHICAW
jgi:hypothetical protein